MRITKNPVWTYARAPLATAMLATMVSTPIQAVPFTLGDNVEGSFDLTVNAGLSMRIAKPDSALIGPGNGGTGGATKTASDDGSINWARGKTFSESVTALPELELVMGDFGAFMRGKVFYDFAIEGDKAAVRQVPEGEKDIAGSSITLLDAFVWGNFEVGDQYLDVRVGQQVVNWGEALFAISGGINTINPLDGAAATAPGVEIKEIVLPTVMLYATLSLTDTTSIEGFFRPAKQWEQTLAPSCGTFFGTDYISTYSDACNFLNLGAPDSLTEAQVLGSHAAIPRGPDVFAHKDEFGLSYRFAIEALDTEFGVYYVQYNNTAPSIYAKGVTSASMSSGLYGLKYIEGLEMFGISASTQKMKISWQWEMSYRPDAYISVGETGLIGGATGQLPTSYAGVYVDDHVNGDVYQMSLTATKVLGQMLGAGSGAVVGEYTINNADFTPGFLFDAATRTSWGYTALFTLSYFNVFSGVNLKPSVTFTHNVNGQSAIGVASFREGRRNISATLAADFRTVHIIKLKYTDYIASDTPTGSDKYDKDFVSLTYSWSL